MKPCIFLVFLLGSMPIHPIPSWGFYGHRLINRIAVYSLPPEMLAFFKKHIDFVTEKAVNPDRRRYAVVGEAEKHFIDLDQYEDSLKILLPNLSWSQAVERVGEEVLRENGIVPWHIQAVKHQLTEAFRTKNAKRILQLATDLGHYIADANVPLHTTKNYNGQLTNQHGIHGLWETRLPELFSENYDLLIGKARYESDIPARSWKAVLHAHMALDSVLLFEKLLTEQSPPDQKYTIVERNSVTGKNYSLPFSEKYHRMLDQQVERQMRSSIKMVADFWYSAWVDAGQPALSDLPPVMEDPEAERELMKAWLQKLLDVRRESDH